MDNKEGVQRDVHVRVLREPEVMDRTALSRSSLRRGIAAGWFPRPFKLVPGGTAAGWLSSSIDTWLVERAGATVVQAVAA